MMKLTRLYRGGRRKIRLARKSKTRAKAWRKAYNRGYDDGYDKGYEARCQASEQEARLLEQEMEHRSQSNASGAYNKGFDKGHDTGYDKGYKAGFDKAASVCYEQGLYEGGEGWIDRLLPPDSLAPDISVGQVIEAGLRQMESRFIRALSAGEVAQAMTAALEHKQPLSVVRLGDGELLTLCQETVLSIDEVRSRGGFLGYAGIQVPDLAARDRLAEAIRLADIVGVPQQRLKNFQPLLVPALNAFGMDVRRLRLTFSVINYSIFYEGYLPRLVKGRKVLAIGNHAGAMTEVLARQGLTMANPIAPVAGMGSVPDVMNRVRGTDFDLALVSAGVAAVPITQAIATEMGRVALDFGHMADMIVNGQVNVTLGGDL